MDKWNTLVIKDVVEKTVDALKANGINARFVKTGKEAYDAVLSLIPEGSEVMNMTSVTLDSLGLPKELNESGKYNSIRNKLNAMDRATQGLAMQKLGAAPEFAIGSVQAVTENGEVLIASNTGSQLSAYAGGSPNVIWVVGTQKIVKNTKQALERIYQYVLPLEAERINKALNMTKGSFVSKLLVINREIRSGRITLIFVNEVLGF